MEQNEIKVVKQQKVLGKDFKVYGDALDPLFLAKDIADLLGHSNVSSMLKSVDNDEKVLNNVYTPGGSQESWFLTEDGLYETLFQSRKPIAKQFKKEVKTILKDLRRTGVVITESATDESIDYQAKYGRYRIRRTFNESKDLRATYEEYAALSKIERDAHRIDNKDRIRNCKAIMDVIETKIAENITDMRGSEILALRELALDVQADITLLHNKRNSGIKSAQTKKIQQLEELVATQDENTEYYLIEKHPFTNNCMYDYIPGGRTKTIAYRAWINNLHLEEYLPEKYPNLDITKPMRITLLYGHMDKFDTVNFEKSIIDQVSNYYGFDDKLIKSATQELHSYVDSYEDGYMYLRIENIEDNE